MDLGKSVQEDVDKENCPSRLHDLSVQTVAVIGVIPLKVFSCSVITMKHL